MGCRCGRLDLVLTGALVSSGPGAALCPQACWSQLLPRLVAEQVVWPPPGPSCVCCPSVQGLLFPGLLALPVSGSVDCRPTASSDSWSPPGGLTSTSPGLSGEGGGPSPLLISLVSLVQPPKAGQAQVASSEGSPDSTGRMAQTSPWPCPQSALLGIAAQRLHSPGDSPASAVLPHEPWSRPPCPSRLDVGLALPLRA